MRELLLVAIVSKIPDCAPVLNLSQGGMLLEHTPLEAPPAVRMLDWAFENGGGGDTSDWYESPPGELPAMFRI